MDNRWCPIIKDFCKESRCAWWITGVKECAVNSLAQSVDCLVENGLTVEVMEACHEN